MWTALVQTYSHLDLTLEKDRLAALAGVVQWLHEKCTFMLGFWNDVAGKGLSWEVVRKSVKKETSCGLPSWSWLSASSGIDWSYNEKDWTVFPWSSGTFNRQD
jgi:hypothetical protein